MIRYVDISVSLGEDSYNFAWWDTVNDRFMIVGRAQAWETWADFEQSLSEDLNYPQALERFKNLYPIDKLELCEGL